MLLQIWKTGNYVLVMENILLILRSSSPESEKSVCNTSRNGHMKLETIYYNWKLKPWMFKSWDNESTVDLVSRIPKTVDFLMFSGSEEGFRSYILKYGSGFIKTFCRVMSTCYKTASIMNMNKIVIRGVKAMKNLECKHQY